MARDPYIFDCLKLQDDARGRALEHALIDDIQRFLLELGSGVRVLRPSEGPLVVGDQECFLDLLFYHHLGDLHAPQMSSVRARGRNGAGTALMFATQFCYPIRTTNRPRSGPKGESPAIAGDSKVRSSRLGACRDSSAWW